MKKLLLLLLVFTGMVSTASADNMYIVGDAPFGGWKTNVGTAMTDNGDGTFSYEFTATDDAKVYFCFASALASTDADWDTFNSSAYRPSGESKELQLCINQAVTTVASGYSFFYNFVSGTTYTIVFDQTNLKTAVYTKPDLYLRSNINATSGNSYKTWETDLANMGDYKFTFSEYNIADNKLHYYYTVSSTQLAQMITNGQTDLCFRTEQEGDNFQVGPEQNTDYAVDFSANGKYSASCDSWSNNESCINGNGAFKVNHSAINATDYTIDVYVTYADWGRTISQYVTINSMPVTMAAAKGTFCCDRALNFSGTGINAYLITGVASSGVLSLSDPLTLVPANTPLYIEGSTANIPVVTTSDASGVVTSSNKLKKGEGSAVAETESEGALINFILTNKTTSNPSAPLMFYRANGNAVPTNRAYLQLSSGDVGAREFVWFEDEMTGIEKVSVGTKALDGAVYNLAGQRVAQPTKGLYIMNGKKVVLK